MLSCEKNDIGAYCYIGAYKWKPFNIIQPDLRKIRTSVHFLCDTVLRTLLNVSAAVSKSFMNQNSVHLSEKE